MPTAPPLGLALFLLTALFRAANATEPHLDSVPSPHHENTIHSDNLVPSNTTLNQTHHSSNAHPYPDSNSSSAFHASPHHPPHSNPETASPPPTSPLPPTQPDLSAFITAITALLNKKTTLLHALSIHSAYHQHATDALHHALHRRNLLLSEKHAAELLNHDLHTHIAQLHTRVPRYDQTLAILARQADDARAAIDTLRSEAFWLVRHNARLADALRQKGLEHWVQNSVKDSVAPFVSDALVQGTASVVEPVLDGIERLAIANGHLSDTMKDTLRSRVPIVDKPFYAGFVTYLVLLAPVVLVTSLVLKVKRGFSKIALAHLVIIGNLYFLLLSGGCFVATVLGAVDVLLTFRHYNLSLFDSAMVIHGLFYVSHVLSQVRLSLQTREKSGLIHVLLLCVVGMHFFVHSYRHAMHHEDPHVDKKAYFFYTGIFLFVLYDRIVKQLRRQGHSRDMKLNNTSISTSVNQFKKKQAPSCMAMVPATNSSTRISF